MEFSRREFLENSMWATAVGVAAGAVPFDSATALAADSAGAATTPNEKLGVAVIGAGIRGTSHCKSLSARSDVELLYVCDADSQVGQKRTEEFTTGDHRPQFAQDFRNVLDDPAVDVVTIATPNHWHAVGAVWAMRAGKDVFVEKPVSHNVAEGRVVVETAREFERICQTGTQCRSMQGTIDAINYVHSGAIGEVKLARGLCYNPRGSIGPAGVHEPPGSVDYSLWSGPAELLPVTRPQFHYDWHWQFPYGNGDLGNQGIHQMDIARWGLGLDRLSNRVFSYGDRVGYEDAGETPNTQVVFHEFDEATSIFEVRGLPTDGLRGVKVGVIFYGSDGYVILTSYTSGAAFDADGQLVRRFNGGGDHFENFFQAVRSRKVEGLAADILEGHLSSALCHTGEISWKLGQPTRIEEMGQRVESLALADAEDAHDTMQRFANHLKDNSIDPAKTHVTWGAELTMDPKSESFVNHSEANALLTREYRQPFTL